MTKKSSIEERIAAFLDGQMNDAETAAFEAEMNADPELAEVVVRMADNDDLLRSAFDAPIQQGVDDALIARMGLAEPESAQVIDIASARQAKVIAANDDSPGWQRWRWPAMGAVAAAVVAAVMLQTGPSTSPDAQFAQAMESLPSGQIAKLAAGETVQPLLTFKAGDGRYCREFSRSGAQPVSGIACRGGNGWSVEAKAKGATALGNSGQIETAAGADDSVLADAYARLNASDPLDGETEEALIAKGWSLAEK